MPRKIALTTGPSIFQENVHSMIEDYLGWNYIYCLNNNRQNLDELAEKADIYIGGGGRDVFPATYGSPLLKNENMENFDRMRDLREIHLIKKFIELGKPVAGICRNFQLYCIKFLGMTLTDINFGGSDVCHSPSASGIKLKDDEQEFVHTVKYFGQHDNQDDNFWVNSHHHMGILLPVNKQKEIVEPDGVEYLAIAGLGGDKNPDIIEWIKDNNNNVNMVQFHPENIYRTNELSQMFLEQVKAMVG